MNGLAETAEGPLLNGLSQAGMGGNRCSDIFETRTHFQRQAKSGAKLGDTLADRLDTKVEMIVSPGNDANEAVVPLQRHRPTVASERKGPDTGLDACISRLDRRLPNGNQFGIGKADRGNGNLVPDRFLPATISATISPWAMARCASIGSLYTHAAVQAYAQAATTAKATIA